MNVELVAQMFKNYQSNVLFHLEGMTCRTGSEIMTLTPSSDGESERATMNERIHVRSWKSQSPQHHLQIDPEIWYVSCRKRARLVDSVSIIMNG